ncbi:hypothetical protein [Streptomyces salinarius]|uniref:hypothetical protein n=1 Tax=Streptomyces salinarius TaxID=2762598 RepID=UPI0013D91371|nr:hypothetical protein [Streptomyces salinarius]
MPFPKTAPRSKTGQVRELPTFPPIGKDAQGRERRALLVNSAFPAGPGECSSKYVYHWVGTWGATNRRWTPDTTEPELMHYCDRFTRACPFRQDPSACACSATAAPSSP